MDCRSPCDSGCPPVWGGEEKEKEKEKMNDENKKDELPEKESDLELFKRALIEGVNRRIQREIDNCNK